jgi:hypothetical protein
MLSIDNKVLVHFNTNDISAYSLKDNTLKMMSKKCVAFEESSNIEILLEKIGKFLDNLEKLVGVINNERIRLYATGIFQKIDQLEQAKLIIQVYVNYGLYFNIVSSELEQFYLKNSMSINGTKNMMDGLIYQEFRKVVIAGSFQKHLANIGEIMIVLQRYNIMVLSPWTTKIQPRTLGTDFILLEGQEPLKNKRDSWTHKSIHMDKFRQSDAVVVCNPEGAIGQSTMFELGYMAAISQRIIFTEPPKDLSILFPYEVGLNF